MFFETNEPFPPDKGHGYKREFTDGEIEPLVVELVEYIRANCKISDMVSVATLNLEFVWRYAVQSGYIWQTVYLEGVLAYDRMYNTISAEPITEAVLQMLEKKHLPGYVEQRAKELAELKIEKMLKHKIEEEVRKRMKVEREKLLDEFMKEEELEHDRGFYSEYVRKQQEQDDREKDFEYREREIKLTEREMGVALQIREKDIEIAGKLVEATKLANQASHDLAMKDVIVKLVEVEREGLAQRTDLLKIERRLLEVKSEEFEYRAREVLMDIREKQMTLSRSRIALDKQRMILERDKIEYPKVLEERYQKQMDEVYRNIGYL